MIFNVILQLLISGNWNPKINENQRTPPVRFLKRMKVDYLGADCGSDKFGDEIVYAGVVSPKNGHLSGFE